MDPSAFTVLFVPGAWHRAESFARVAETLDRSGFNTTLVDLPSVGPEAELDGLMADVHAIRERASEAISRGQKIVLVAHSYGGIPSSEAIQGFSPHVAHFFLCCSFILPRNESLLSALGGRPPPWWDVSPDESEVLARTPADIFYNDLAAEEAEAAAGRLRPHSFGTFRSPVGYEAWRIVPTTYLYCTLDKAVPIAAQRAMVEQTAGDVDVRTDTLESGHSPFFKCPDDVAASIERAVRASS